MAFPKDFEIEIPLLKVLKEAGRPLTPQEAIPRVCVYFPALTTEDLAIFRPSGKERKWDNMVRWARQRLVDRGAIDGSIRGMWGITDIGRALVEVAEPSPPLPPSPRQARPRSHPPAAPALPTTPEQQPERPRAVIPLDRNLYHRLRTTSQSGTDAVAFEEALAEAFRFLGFDAVQIGGRSDTDVKITSPLGKDAYVAIIDAKSSRTGRVPDTSLNFASLRDHKEKNRADHVMVIAPSFTRGNAIKHAEREDVTLMELEPFIGILDMHQRTPLSLLVLREMFLRPGLYGTEPDRIREATEHTERLSTLLPRVIQKMEYWYQLGLQAPATADSLFIAFVEEFREARYTKDQIEAALQHLASPFVGALRQNETGYYLTMSSPTVQRRLLSLGQKFTTSDFSIRGTLIAGS